jgi:hypothetical protein
MFDEKERRVGLFLSIFPMFLISVVSRDEIAPWGGRLGAAATLWLGSD